MEEVADGIVIYTEDRGESDKIVTLLTPDKKIYATLRGVKKSTAKLRAYGQLFAFGEFTYAESAAGSSAVITGAQMTDSFYKLTESPERYFFGCFYLEVVNYITIASKSEPEILIDLLRSLEYLTYSDVAPEAVTIKFLLRLMTDGGHKQCVTRCAHCGGKPQYYFYDAKMGGLQCERCRTGRRISEQIALELGRVACAQWEDLEGQPCLHTACEFLIKEFEFLYDTEFKTAKLIL